MSILDALPAVFLSWFQSIDPSTQVWLVGGAIRDHFLDRATIDLDFAVSGDALALARQAADRLEGDVFALDSDRGTARVLLDKDGPGRRVLDFAALRGETIEADLRARDFSVNSLALDLRRPDELIDPCQGLQDLRNGAIRVCSSRSIDEDAVRALRAIRLASVLGFRIEEATQERMRSAAPDLASISRERVRDELFRMLAVDEPATPYYLVRYFGFEPVVFGSEMPADKAQLMLAVWRELGGILAALAPEYDPETAANAHMGLLVWQLGRYRGNLQTYLFHEVSTFRRCRELTFLGSREWLLSESRRVMTGAADVLRLSQVEARWLSRFTGGMELSASLEAAPLEIYRFFRTASESGAACGLVHLAYVLAREEGKLQGSDWAKEVEKVRSLLEAFFERREILIDPAPILTGDDLLRELQIEAGPRIGQILERLRELQVAGAISSRAEALAAAENLIRPT
ncbi:MAG: hypothetical protein ACK2TX_11050 [Anaerolineales bacterium]